MKILLTQNVIQSQMWEMIYFFKWISEKSEVARDKDEVLAKLYFSNQVSTEQLIQRFEGIADEYKEVYDYFILLEAEAIKNKNQSKQSLLIFFTLRKAILIYEASYRWALESIK